MTNKRAQIATSLMVALALTLSAAALFAMLSFKDNFQSQSFETTSLISEVQLLKDYISQKARAFGSILVNECSTSCDKNKLAALGSQFDAQRTERFQNEGNFFAKLRNGEFTFTAIENNKYKLETNKAIFKVEKNLNKIETTLKFCMIFNDQGNFIENC